MSSPGQAADLSMDEILASIRKIISEDPKPASAIAQARAPATDGMLTAAHAARRNPTVKPPVAPSHGREPIQNGARTVKPTLDDDILDLLDEDNGPTTAVAAAVSDAASPDVAKSGQSQSASRPGLSDMWTPREWSKPGAATSESGPAAQAKGIQPAAASLEEPTEARLEAAIAALGQSLATPQQADLPAKPIVVATAPKIPAQPGPRIDVVAVVNAATRAALAQRSADEQIAMPVSAVPLPALPVAAERPEPQTTLVPLSAVTSAAAAIREPSPPVIMATPAVAPAVNAAVEVALAASRAAPPRAGIAKAPEAKPLEIKKADIKKPENAKMAGATVDIEPRPNVSPAAASIASPVPVVEVSKPAPENSSNVAPPVTAAGSNGGGNAYVAVATPLPVPPAGVQTLEDTVARLLRPMLRQWLDDNMPRIVEKAFKEELAAQATPSTVATRKAN